MICFNVSLDLLVNYEFKSLREKGYMRRKSLGLLGVFTLFKASTSDLFYSEENIEYLIDALKRSGGR